MNEQIMWYYQHQERRAGPVAQTELIELIKAGTVTRSTLVWKEGMDEWEEAYLAGLADYFAYESPTEEQTAGIKGYLCSKQDLPQKLRTWYLIFGISLCVSIFLSAMGPISWIAALASSFFGLLIMYHAWNVIPADKRPFSPVVIVVLMIIPIFNLAWIFVCYYGAARKINVELESRGITDFKISETLALGYCVIAVLMTAMFVVSYITGAIFPSFTLILVIAIVFVQVMLMRYFVVSIAKLLKN